MGHAYATWTPPWNLQRPRALYSAGEETHFLPTTNRFRELFQVLLVYKNGKTVKRKELHTMVHRVQQHVLQSILMPLANKI